VSSFAFWIFTASYQPETRNKNNSEKLASASLVDTAEEAWRKMLSRGTLKQQQQQQQQQQ